MQITEVKVSLRDYPGNVRAYVSITFDSAFVVKRAKIITKPVTKLPTGEYTKDGVTPLAPDAIVIDDKLYTVAMPSDRNPKTGKWDDIAHPINAETRAMMEKAIFDKYFEELENAKNNPTEKTEE